MLEAMSRYNFSAGPGALPAEVVEAVAAEMARRERNGATVMEISHRSREFVAIAEKAEQDLRRLLGIGDTHVVLFLQGGATGQFSAVPLNLVPEGGRAAHVVTGHWSRRAADEAARFCTVDVIADSEPDGYRRVPDPATWEVPASSAYLAYAANETIDGVEMTVPPAFPVPLVADASSNLLSRPLDVSRFGVLYAGAQKNLGPAGLTVVVVERDLLGGSGRVIPTVLDYAAMAESGSMLNTPPTFAWYVAGLVFEWLIAQGGLEEMERRNRRKQALVYEAIDASPIYSNLVDARYRSWMNVPFSLTPVDLESAFLTEAAAAGFIGLKGHRSVGGVRVSLYNAVTEESVQALVGFMRDFQDRHC